MTQVVNSSTTEVPNFTPSLGLRYWMNRMKRANSTNTQDNNDKISSKSVTMDGIYARSTNDATSAISVSGTTSHSFFGVDSVHAYDIDSSLRVLHHHVGGCASSERSSFMSDDIQSNASIKSKPWVSQLLPTNGQHQHTPSTHSIDPSNLVISHQSNTHLLMEQKTAYDEDDEDDDDDDDDYLGTDGDILYSTSTTTSSYSADHHASLHSIRSAEDIQPTTTIHNNEEGYVSQQQEQQQQQQPQPQRRWSDDQCPPSPPRPLGRIKAGLGRLMGREHSTSTIDQRGSLA